MKPRTYGPISFAAPSWRVARRWALKLFWGTGRVDALARYRTLTRRIADGSRGRSPHHQPGRFWAGVRHFRWEME